MADLGIPRDIKFTIESTDNGFEQADKNSMWFLFFRFLESRVCRLGKNITEYVASRLERDSG